MWVHTSKIDKTIVFPHKTKVENLIIQILQKHPQIIVENTKKPPNSSIYTIEYKIVRNSHPLSQNWHFLKCHSNCSTNKRKLLTHKVSSSH